jgi:O-antigen/teichoic acid export membrane protein
VQNFRNISITFGSTIVIIMANTVGGILTARILGPTGKGELTAVMLWPNIFASIGSLGMVESIAYFAGRERSQNLPSILSTGWLIASAQAVTLMLIGFLVMPGLMQQYSSLAVWTGRLFLLFIPLNLVTLYQRSIFHGRGLMAIYNALALIVNCGYVVILGALAVAGFLTVLTCTLALLFVQVILLAYELYWLGRKDWFHLARIFPIRPILSYGLKAHIGNISSTLNLRLDQMLMAAILPPDVLGLYVVAVTLSNGVGLFSSAIALVTFPAMVSSGRNTQHKSFAKFMRLNFWVTAILAVAMLVLSPILTQVLFGQSYVGSVATCRILCVAAVFASMSSVLKSGLKGLGKPLISTYGELVGLVGTAVLLFALLPRWQMLGAAIASLIAYALSFSYMFAYMCNHLKLPPYVFFVPQAQDKVEFISLAQSMRRIWAAH